MLLILILVCGAPCCCICLQNQNSQIPLLHTTYQYHSETIRFLSNTSMIPGNVAHCSALTSGLSARHLTLLCFRTDPASLRELGACATRDVYEASPCNMLKVNSLCKKRVIHIRTHTLSCLLPTMSIIPVPWCIARHSIPTRVRGSGAAQGMPPQRPSAAPLQAAAAATAAAATAARRASAFSALAAILRCHG